MIKKIITYIVSSIVFLSIVNPLLESTIYDNTVYLMVFILFINACELFIEKRIVAHVLQIIALYTVAFMYVSKASVSLEWIYTFTTRVVSNVFGFMTRTDSLILHEAGIFVVALLLLILVKLSVRSEKIWIAGLVILSYFLILVSFNNSIIHMSMVQLISGMILWRMWILYDFDLFKRPLYAVGTCVLVVCLMIASIQYTDVYRDLYLAIRQSTVSYRDALTDRGFYRFFNLNRVTGIGAVSGYSLDDRNLGGPMRLNYAPVFTVVQTKPTYWKLENKYVYTGKGWRSVDDEIFDLLIAGSTYEEDDAIYVDTVNTSTIIEVNSGLPYVPVPFGKVVFDDLGSLSSLSLYTVGDMNRFLFSKIINPTDDQSQLESISYAWSELALTPEMLRSVEFSNTSDILTQIPGTVTTRTKDLAYSITDGATNQYDKVEAVRLYLTQNRDFSYDLGTVLYTPENADFVDYFLFDMQRGYCEHYSTAMVVLLRILGIPARWVKGYSTGVVSDLSKKEYTIRNADAHAWVEVYFEGYGWVPFEATPSFNTDFLQEETIDPNPENPNENPGEERPNENVNPNPSRPDDNQPTPTTPEQKQFNVWLLGFGGALILMVLYSCRRFFMLLWVKLVLYRGTSYRQSFECVLYCLNWHVPRFDYVGVSAYADLMDDQLREEYLQLVPLYTAIRYGDADDRPLSSEEKKHFKHIMKHIKIRQLFY